MFRCIPPRPTLRTRFPAQKKDEIGRLIPEVRAVREPLSICPSAQKDVHIAEILKAIVDKQVYQKDYEDITMRLLFVPESYEEVIKSIELLSKSDIWE